MSKPTRDVEIETADGKKAGVHAVLDTGSFYTIVREDCLPKGALVSKFKKKEIFGTARRGGKLSSIGFIPIKICLEGHWISGEARVAPELGSEMLIGAGLMQMWDISIKNKNGHTRIIVGRDMQDPDIQTVLWTAQYPERRRMRRLTEGTVFFVKSRHKIESSALLTKMTSRR